MPFYIPSIYFQYYPGNCTGDWTFLVLLKTETVGEIVREVREERDGEKERERDIERNTHRPKVNIEFILKIN